VAGLTVLDVRPPPLRARGAAAARAGQLSQLTGHPDAAAELRRRKLVRARVLAAMGAPARATPVAGDWLADPDWWGQLRDRLAAEVAAYATKHPLEPGMPAESARQRLGLPDRALVIALTAAPLRYRDGRIYGSAAAPDLPADVLAAVEAIRAGLRADPFQAPDAARLRELRLGHRQLAAAVRAGLLVRLSAGVYLLPGAAQDAARILAGLPQPFTPSEARQALRTTRRIAVPLLELLDRLGATVRLDETRRRAR
jgi:selenocysteine-specific elongation factor